jgi:hypothetical protein
MQQQFHNNNNLLLRNKTFLKEFQQFTFSCSTTVEFKIKHKTAFKQYKLLLFNRKLYILNFPQSKSIALKNTPLPLWDVINLHNSNGFNLRYPILSLNFDLITAKLLISNENKLIMTILVLGCDKQFDIRIQTKSVFDKYVKLIQTAIVTSDGYQRNLIELCLRNEKFYKYNYISNKEFISKARTGDVILFRGLEHPAPLQRFFTGDEYDHVAMVKRRDGSLFIYEATLLGKCSLLSWTMFLFRMFNLLYDKIVYRPLIYETSNKEEEKEMRKHLEEKAKDYVQITHKKDYLLSVCSVICWGGAKEKEKNKQWKELKGYSCSGLLTGAYYHMGVTEITQDTRSILPGHFAQNDNTTLSFTKGFSLGPEEILEFSCDP